MSLNISTRSKLLYHHTKAAEILARWGGKRALRIDRLGSLSCLNAAAAASTGPLLRSGMSRISQVDSSRLSIGGVSSSGSKVEPELTVVVVVGMSSKSMGEIGVGGREDGSWMLGGGDGEDGVGEPAVPPPPPTCSAMAAVTDDLRRMRRRWPMGGRGLSLR